VRVREALKTLVGPSDKDALPALLDVYAHRADLNEAFPEAADGDHGRLILWAAAVARGEWSDPARAELGPHADWYVANVTGKLGPPLDYDWPTIRAASESASNRLPVTIDAMSTPPSDTSHHLPTLSLLITEFRLRSVVELGVRAGVSTLALLEAAAAQDGSVLSVDVEPCPEARARVEDARLGDRWRFVQMSDLDVPDEQIPDPIDLLFVDTTHLYDHTVAELDKYGAHLRSGSWLALHDYTSCAGVTRAVRDWICARPGRARLYPFVNQNGLAVIRVADLG
jgi:predicted O-methyltransferase YrrM